MITVIVKSNPVYEDGTKKTSETRETKYKFECSRDAVLFNKSIKKELGYISSTVERG